MPDTETPDRHSVEIMRCIDALSRPMRALVREHGWVIVREMIADGYTDPLELADLLETWRERRQEQWLATDYISKRTVDSIVEAAFRRAA